MIKITPFFILIALSCQTPQNRAEVSPPLVQEEKDPSKIYSFMNQELPPKTISEETRRKFEGNLEIAKTNLDSSPDSLDLIIWYGRRLAYLGNYLDAIQVYSDGLVMYPSSYRLRRHRGHRYITSRQIDKAIQDYEMAAYYSLNSENQIEPDGLPNKLNKPLGNDKFNIWYHFGLAYYLYGRYDKALSAYTKCMEFSDNDDLKAATSYWQYLTYKKLGNTELANELLKAISSKMIMVENHAYLDLLLLFKGEKNGDELIKEATNDQGQLNPTLAYGIGSYFQHQGRFAKANEIFLKTVESSSWDAFGYIAAEAELKTIFPVP
ncbi:MAG: tetratricopeptide repeat protein [Bacteroidota bacterium]